MHVGRDVFLIVPGNVSEQFEHLVGSIFVKFNRRPIHRVPDLLAVHFVIFIDDFFHDTFGFWTIESFVNRLTPHFEHVAIPFGNVVICLKGQHLLPIQSQDFKLFRLAQRADHLLNQPESTWLFVTNIDEEFGCIVRKITGGIGTLLIGQ